MFITLLHMGVEGVVGGKDPRLFENLQTSFRSVLNQGSLAEEICFPQEMQTLPATC